MEMQSDTSVTRGVENAPGAFLLCRKCGPNAVPNVEHVHNVIALIQAVNDSVDVWLLPKKEVAKLLIFRDDQAAAGKSLQTIDCFGETIEPSERVLGSIRFDVIEDRLHIPQGASGEPNEVFHGRGGKCPELPALDARGPSLRPQALAGFPRRHRLAPRCRADADRPQHPARPLPLCR